MNLKWLLMELGNRLVVNHHYTPFADQEGKTTIPIQMFAEFINESSEARWVLQNLDVDWPMKEVKDEPPTQLPDF